MAFIMPKTYDDGQDYYYYCNGTPVGTGKNGHSKKRSDVQLVQFFLFQFYLRHNELFRQLPKTIGGPSVDVTGEVNKQTIAGIRLFQDYMNRNGAKAVVDGRVSVPVAGDCIPGSETPYTIIRLNYWFFYHPKRAADNRKWIGNLHDHPVIFTLAPELHAELSTLEELEVVGQ